MTTAAVELTTLLPSKHKSLIYALPLLILSILLTFAGTFLLLDRSRSFTPRNHFSPQEKKSYTHFFRLEGGVGGLAVGYVFGIHLSTFLAMLIPNISSSAPLTPVAFLVLCLLSAIFCAILAGRFKIAAVLFTGLTGGALTSLVLSIMFHPPLLGRWILFAILTTLVAAPTAIMGSLSTYTHSTSKVNNNNCLVSCLPYLTHSFLRFSTASTGSFGIILSIALLLKHPAKSWANAWERLWVSDGQGWGTSQEKGLIAAWVFFTALGVVEDWALRKWLGDNPDEAWDDYLSSYVQALPYSSNRAGTFKPLPSFWDRLFRRHSKASKPAFPGFFDEDPPTLNSELDNKLKPLLADDLSSSYSPISESAIPEPIYSHTPPPPSQLGLLRSKSKPAATVDSLTDDGNDGGESPEGSEDYTLPPFIKKRKKKDKLAKLRLQLHNPDGGTSSRHRPLKSAGFKALPQKAVADSSSDVEMGRNPMKNNNFARFEDGSMSSATLVSTSDGRSVGHHDDASGSGRSADAKRKAGKENNKDVDHQHRGAAPEYSDYEVDLTTMAASLGARQRQQRELKEQGGGGGGGVPEFIQRQMPQPSPAPPVATTTPAAETSAANTTGADSIASDRARERVRAFVASTPTRRHSIIMTSRPQSVPKPQSPEAAKILHSKERADMPTVPTPNTAQLLSPLPLPAPVPATPSLLNALHRVVLAQQQAFGAPPTAISDPMRNGIPDDGLPKFTEAGVNGSKDASTAGAGLPHNGPNDGILAGGNLNLKERRAGNAHQGAWDDFWRDVKAKARSPER